MNVENKGFMYGLMAVIAFGFTLPISKLLLQYWNPFFIAFARSVLASIFAIIFLLIWEKHFPSKKQFLQLFIIALGVILGFPVFSTVAMETLPASHGAIMIGILPLTTSVFGTLLTKDKPSILFWISSIFGSGLVVLYALIEGNGSFYEGDFFLLIAIFVVSIGYALGARLAKEMNGWKVISWALVISLPYTLLVSLWYLPSNVISIPYSGYLYFLYLGMVSQLFAFFAWYKGLLLGGIARVSQVQLIQVFVTFFASSILLDEAISMLMIVFTILVLSTVWIAKQMPIN
jgi:drug/metabolite transporter (DMT)-like permease